MITDGFALALIVATRQGLTKTADGAILEVMYVYSTRSDDSASLTDCFVVFTRSIRQCSPNLVPCPLSGTQCTGSISYLLRRYDR